MQEFDDDEINDTMRQCVAEDVFKKALQEQDELNEFVELEKEFVAPEEEVKQSSTEPETEIEIPVESSENQPSEMRISICGHDVYIKDESQESE